MKIPLNRAELVEKWGHFRFTVICVAMLILMLVFGYQIARFEMDEGAKASASESESVAFLAQQNKTLKNRVSELQVEAILADNSVAAMKKSLEEQLQQNRALEDRLSFYQRVVAPEVTQDGFFIDGVQVAASASDNRYRLTAVLLQQNENKTILKGELGITVRGALDGVPHEVSTSDTETFPSGPVKWGFKYFQTVDLEFTLPAGFVPEQIIFTTDVIQWKTKRGEYFNSLDWSDVFDSPVNAGSQDS